MSKRISGPSTPRRRAPQTSCARCRAFWRNSSPTHLLPRRRPGTTRRGRAATPRRRSGHAPVEHTTTWPLSPLTTVQHPYGRRNVRNPQRLEEAPHVVFALVLADVEPTGHLGPRAIEFQSPLPVAARIRHGHDDPQTIGVCAQRFYRGQALAHVRIPAHGPAERPTVRGHEHPGDV